MDSRSAVHQATTVQASDTKYMTFSKWLPIICHKYERIKSDFLPYVSQIL